MINLRLRLTTLIISVLILLISSLNVAAQTQECEVFQDDFLWSSNMSFTEDSVNYRAWNIQNKCPGSSNCFIEKINVFSRLVDFTEVGPAIGYFQISNADETNCRNPERATYSNYGSYFVGQSDENSLFDWNCGSSQANNLCSLTKADRYTDETDCYSIKLAADKRAIIDVIKINYTWCWTGPRIKTEDVVVELPEEPEEPLVVFKKPRRKSADTSSETNILTSKSFIITALVIIILIIILRRHKWISRN